MAVHMGGLGEHLTAEFFNWVHAVHVKVLPLNEVADIRVWTDLNPDDGTGLLELHAPLVYGVGSQASDQVSYSDLFESVVRFHTSLSSDESSLSVKSSKFELRVGTAPGVRFEYERENRTAPTAHIHHSGVAGLLSPALMKNFSGVKNPRKKGRIEDIHFPIGGRRFRVSLEDYFFFLFMECGFRSRPGWKSFLAHSREKWLDDQLRGAVADNQEVAAQVLREMGYTVERKGTALSTDARGHRPW